ncbi:YlqD family protein [Romeria aff. gracilis LEGE 07310]|uniref:YlqD family protein n=1 Tax=Vasconcelosia minhoensis LEGE 07310 TaxID=915328 RepID=A0A8J7AB88_9CYAN|nr:YlqD family protein [Romeria gracilis]MBE9076424.1 YlqD family protein [Romeria aff. gracilis LEGE 07310]
MDVPQSQLLLKRVINIKAVVTPLWKEEAQKQLQNQLNQIDGRLQQLEMQGQRMVSEIQKQGTDPSDPAVSQQISSVQGKLNQDKGQQLQQKNQLLQQLQQVQTLELNKEVSQGQIDGFFRVAVGDNMIRKLQVEILLRDGVVEEIRGEL